MILCCACATKAHERCTGEPCDCECRGLTVSKVKEYLKKLNESEIDKDSYFLKRPTFNQYLDLRGFKKLKRLKSGDYYFLEECSDLESSIQNGEQISVEIAFKGNQAYGKIAKVGVK